MSIVPMLKMLGATGATLFALDLLWLGVIAKAFYARHMGVLLRPDVVVPAWGHGAHRSRVGCGLCRYARIGIDRENQLQFRPSSPPAPPPRTPPRRAAA
jgi:hypothetical protein